MRFFFKNDLESIVLNPYIIIWLYLAQLQIKAFRRFKNMEFFVH